MGDDDDPFKPLTVLNQCVFVCFRPAQVCAFYDTPGHGGAGPKSGLPDSFPDLHGETHWDGSGQSSQKSNMTPLDGKHVN